MNGAARERVTSACIAFAVFAACHAPIALAQQAAQPEDQLQEVVVTAEKRTEDIQKTSISIAAVGGEQIAQDAKNTIEDVIRDIPNVQVQGLAQGAQIFIRGVGSSIDPSFADPSIALMVDGAYNGRTESVVSGGFDIARVEILRGPQGTLYGRNASGGSVNMITNSPELGQFSGDARLQIGNYGLVRGEAAVNLPVGDMFALRVAGFDEKHSGYISDGSMDDDERGGRVKLLFQPNSAVSIMAKAELWQGVSAGINTVPVPGSAGNLTFPPFMPIFTPNGWVTPTSSPWSQDVWHPPGRIERRAFTGMLQGDFDLGFGVLTILPSYTKETDPLFSNYLFGTIPPGGGYTWMTEGAIYRSIETRLASEASSPIKWLLGAYYLSSQGGPSGTTSVSFTGGSTFEADQNYPPSDTVAFYGQTTYPIVDRFRLVAGLRWSRDTEKESFDITNPQLGYDSGVSNYSHAQASTTYKAGFEFDVAAKSMLYAHVSSGFKQGGISPAIPPITFKPEYLTSYELGIKNRFFDDRLQVNADVFYYDYRDYQISVFNSQPLGNTSATYNAAVILNANTSTIRGAELETDWLLTAHDQLTIDVTNLNAVYGQVILNPNPFVGPDPHPLGGRTMANSPEWTGFLRYQHTWELGPGRVVAGADVKLSTGYIDTTEYYLAGAYQQGYHTTDANLRYSAAGDRWMVGAWIKNIENDAQTTYVFPAYRRFVTPPRTFGLNTEVRF